MIKLDEYTKIKVEVVGMNLTMVENAINILAMQIYCPWLFDDTTMEESYYRLIDINKSNFTNIIELMNYIKGLDDNNGIFNFVDLKDEFDCLKNNIELQTSYFDNMLTYINFCDDVFNPTKDIESFCDEYCSKDDDIFDKVQVNRSLIKMIKQERNDKN